MSHIIVVENYTIKINTEGSNMFSCEIYEIRDWETCINQNIFNVEVMYRGEEDVRISFINDEEYYLEDIEDLNTIIKDYILPYTRKEYDN